MPRSGPTFSYPTKKGKAKGAVKAAKATKVRKPSKNMRKPK